MAFDWDWDRTAKSMRRTMRREMQKDRLLRRMGLEERSPTSDFFGGLGLFALGLAVGAGIGLLFAPRPGTEMRNVVGDKLNSMRSRMGRDDSDIHLGAEGTPSSMMP